MCGCNDGKLTLHVRKRLIAREQESEERGRKRGISFLRGQKKIPILNCWGNSND